MNRFRRSAGRDRGFSLVETLVAVSIFAVVTVGLTPLLTSSLRGSSFARSYTVGKNVAVRALERVRGLPFSRSVATTTTARKIDVLDLLFPCAPGTSAQVVNPCATTGTQYVFSGSMADPLRPGSGNHLPAGTFVTTCSAASTNPACPASLPSGYSIRFDAQFVVPVNSAGVETYSVLTSTTSPSLPTTYDWRTAANEIPPVQIVRLRITSYWQVGNETEIYDLDTLVADRKFGIEKIGGVAKVDYAVRVLASYRDAGGGLSDLVATTAFSESGITSRTSAVADQRTTGGTVLLTAQSSGTTQAVSLLDPPVQGASSAYSAPPDQTALPDPADAAAAAAAFHPNLCQDPVQSADSGCQKKLVAWFAATHTKDITAATANDIPTATGRALFNPVTTTAFDVLVDPQLNADATNKNPLNLLPNTVLTSSGVINHPAFSVRPDTAVANNDACMPPANTTSNVCRSMFASTSAVTGPLSGGAARRVETEARVGLPQVRIFPVSFIPGSLGASKAVFEVTDFVARVNCKATGNGTTVASTAEWSAKIRYWKEKASNDGKTDGEYVSETWTHADAGSKLATLKNNNFMVYEHPESTAIKSSQPEDVHMFPITGLLSTENRRGYFTDITGGAPTVTRDTQAGRTATAKLAGALTFSTAPADPDVPQSAMNVVLGSLSCTAADRRT